MSACSQIENKLTKELDPIHLEVIDESYMHNVEPGKESHVRIVVVSAKFEDLNLVKRHQLIYKEINEDDRVLLNGIADTDLATILERTKR